MVAVTMSRSRSRASSFLAMTACSLVTLASAALATPSIDGMYVANPTVGAWKCYELTATGDLVLYPYLSSAHSIGAICRFSAGRWPFHSRIAGGYEIRPDGLVALQPFYDLSTAAVHEEACIGATIH